MNAVGNLRREFETFKSEVLDRLSALENSPKSETKKEEPVKEEAEETKSSKKKSKKYDTVTIETKDNDIVATEN